MKYLALIYREISGDIKGNVAFIGELSGNVTGGSLRISFDVYQTGIAVPVIDKFEGPDYQFCVAEKII